MTLKASGCAKSGYPKVVLNGGRQTQPDAKPFMLMNFKCCILSNNATAVLLLPIAISTAVSLDVDTRPFIIGICFGASACYASPIGYQTNLPVYGPGGYKFSDFIKLGLPLNIMIVILAGLSIPVFWPF